MLVLGARSFPLARALTLSAVVVSLGGCPEDRAEAPSRLPRESARPPAEQRPPIAAAATHGGVISIQDMSIADLPQAGHGLTVQAFFTRLRAPDFEDPPGSPFGCKASSYDLATEPPPAEVDQGKLRLEGLRGGAIGCEFREGRGYVCPTASGSGSASVSTSSGISEYALEGVTLTEADIGRYLQISGASRPENNGAFAILSVTGEDTVAVANSRGAAEMFDAKYTVVAGAGPTPRDLYSPFSEGMNVGVALEAGGGQDFDSFELEITPGSPMTLDTATKAQIVAIEPTGEAMTLGCSGEGGVCGVAAASVIRITTTDGDTTGLSPTAMPPAKRRMVEIQCALPETGSVRVPAEAMELLREAHAASPITRIRTAFMREGFALATNAAPRPANRASVLVGHGVLGFSNPAAK